MERRLSIRLRDENYNQLKERSVTIGAKNLSVYARQILERPPEIDQDLVKEISRVIDLTMRTRQSIGSLTGNINQIARFYNTSAIADTAYIDFDQSSRAQLLPAIKELIESNRKLIALCNRALGRSS